MPQFPPVLEDLGFFGPHITYCFIKLSSNKAFLHIYLFLIYASVE